MVAQEQQEWATAVSHYNQALALFIEFNDRYSQASTYHQLGRVAEEQREWATAVPITTRLGPLHHSPIPPPAPFSYPGRRRTHGLPSLIITPPSRPPAHRRPNPGRDRRVINCWIWAKESPPSRPYGVAGHGVGAGRRGVTPSQRWASSPRRLALPGASVGLIQGETGG